MARAGRGQPWMTATDAWHPLCESSSGVGSNSHGGLVRTLDPVRARDIWAGVGRLQLERVMPPWLTKAGRAAAVRDVY